VVPEQWGRISRRAVFWRLCQLTFFFVLWVAAKGIDRLTGKTPAQVRQHAARRMRHYIETLGGTVIKLGQQASLRRDIFTDDFCSELETLQDKIPPFPVRHAYRAIEEQTGKPWQETFPVLNPEPVGSASVACVYRAILRNGDEVAVKVRRPGIRKAFETDLAVMDLVARIAEFLTLIRPGLSNSFRSEVRGMLEEELDFPSEARYQELFRRYQRRRKKLNVTAPKVYHKFTGREVIVSEFVKGIWVKEIMAKVQEQDEEYLAYLDALGIDPRRVAKRLIRSQHFQFHECPFFHGDPHPGNILVQPDGRIVFVDFGACGVFSQRDRNLMLELNYRYTRGDVAGMVQCVVAIMEPLPRVDIDKFTKELEKEWWRGYYGIISKHAAWEERTSFRLWMALLRALQKFHMPVPLQMLKMIRATLLYDTVAAQLYTKINVFKEFEKYEHSRATRTKRRMVRSVVRQALLGPDDSTVLTLQRFGDVANAVLFRLQKFLAEPELRVEAVVNKVYDFIRGIVGMLTHAVVTGLIGAMILWVRDALAYGYFGFQVVSLQHAQRWYTYWNRPFDLMPGGKDPDRLFQVIAILWMAWVAAVVFSHVRRVLLRFQDKDKYHGRF
jgi:predicted unusual protein kinase regulating ubiquinone biosynthesis (AarF/ABC1/UbiB family)